MNIKTGSAASSDLCLFFFLLVYFSLNMNNKYSICIDTINSNILFIVLIQFHICHMFEYKYNNSIIFIQIKLNVA